MGDMGINIRHLSRTGLNTVIICSMLITVFSCGPQSTRQQQHNIALPPANLATDNAGQLASPLSIAKSTAAIGEQRIRGGADSLTGYTHNVTPLGDAAVFAAEYDLAAPQSSGLAYAVYSFNLAADPPAMPITAMWQAGQVPPAGSLWIGFGHWARNAWSWHEMAPGDQFDVESFEPFRKADGTVLIALVVATQGGGQLEWLRIGDNAPPAIKVDVTGNGERAPQTISIDATASRDYDGSITEFTWDWLANGTVETTGAAPTAEEQLFYLGGTYKVLLTATDNLGQTAELFVDLKLIPHTDWWCAGGNRYNNRRGIANGPQVQPSDYWFYETLRRIMGLVIGTDGSLMINYNQTEIRNLSRDGEENWILPFHVMDSIHDMVVGPDGDIYTRNYKWEEDRARIMAIHPDKSIKWDIPIEQARGCLGMTIDGHVLFGGYDPPHLIAVNRETGAEEWRTPVDYFQYSAASVDDLGNIYLSNYKTILGSGGGLYAFSPDGALRWKYTSTPGRYPPVIGEDGTIYYCDASNHLMAFNATGDQLWSYDNDADVMNLAIGHYLNEERIYFESTDGYIACVDTLGERKWLYRDSTLDSFPTYPILGLDDNLYFPHGDGWIYCLKPNKNPKWMYQALWSDHNIMATPLAIDGEGRMYVNHGQAYGIGAVWN